MNREQLERLFKHDPSLRETHDRYTKALSEVRRLRENREIDTDAIEDTRSYDINIQILEERINDHAWCLNWACKKLGLPQGFPWENAD